MGKIFNALEKYKKERTATMRIEKLQPCDDDALLQYDWVAGKLDLKNPLVTQDPGTVDRLLTYRLIDADGSLTPAGRAKYAELNGQKPKIAGSQPVSEDVKKASRSETAPVSDGKEIETAIRETDVRVPLKPFVSENLTPSDWDVLNQYNRATRKLDVKRQNANVVRRLLDNDMISDDGKLTHQALQGCKELELEKIPPPDDIIGDTGEIEKDVAKSVKIKPVVAIKDLEINKPKTDQPRAVEATTVGQQAVGKKFAELEPVPVREKTQVKNATVPKPSLPPSHNERVDRNLISLFNPQTFEAEQFKILRSNLLYPVSGNPPRSVMVTSLLPGEGKSFVATNLAISVALNINRHVLLMDCDLRRPSIHTRFGFSAVSGLSDYLQHGKSLQDLLMRTSVDKLTILPGGQPPDNPSELLSSERMLELLSEATERYPDRLIILDSPPPTLTAETSVLARWVDGVIIVVKHGETPREGVSEVIDKIGREKIIGAVMNNFEMQSSRYYGKYYGKRYVYNKKKKNV